MAEAGGADRQFFRYPAVSNGAHRSFFYFSEEGLPAPIFSRKGGFQGFAPGGREKGRPTQKEKAGEGPHREKSGWAF